MFPRRSVQEYNWKGGTTVGKVLSLITKQGRSTIRAYIL